MLAKTKSVVLRNVKYGDTSIISTLFTQEFGIQTYLIQGVRSSNKKGSKAGLLQPCTMLEIESDQKPFKNLLRLKEFTPYHYYQQLHENVIRNSVGLFAVEIIYKLLPEQAPLPELFEFLQQFLVTCDIVEEKLLAHAPIYFIVHCCTLTGFNILDNEHSELNVLFTEEESRYLYLVYTNDLISLEDKIMPHSGARRKLLHKLIDYLRTQSQHLGTINTLPILEQILH